MGLAVLKQSSRCENTTGEPRSGPALLELRWGSAAELARRGPRRPRPRV